MNQQGVHSSRPFLLMEGGPLYHIEKRVGLIKEHAPLTIRRAALSMRDYLGAVAHFVCHTGKSRRSQRYHAIPA